MLGKFKLEGIPPAPRGTPQIEVTFDIDANGILNVSAADKATGKTNKITITNDKGRLSKEEIERMVQDAEKFRAEDDQKKAQVEAKNSFENYCFQMKNTLNDEKLKEQFTADDKSTIESTVSEGLQWLEANADADADAIEGKRKEIEAKFSPIMQRVYQAAGGAPGGAGFPGGPMPGGTSGPAPTAGADGVDDLD